MSIGQLYRSFVVLPVVLLELRSGLRRRFVILLCLSIELLAEFGRILGRSLLGNQAGTVMRVGPVFRD